MYMKEQELQGFILEVGEIPPFVVYFVGVIQYFCRYLVRALNTITITLSCWTDHQRGFCLYHWLLIFFLHNFFLQKYLCSKLGTSRFQEGQLLTSNCLMMNEDEDAFLPSVNINYLHNHGSVMFCFQTEILAETSGRYSRVQILCPHVPQKVARNLRWSPQSGIQIQTHFLGSNPFEDSPLLFPRHRHFCTRTTT